MIKKTVIGALLLTLMVFSAACGSKDAGADKQEEKTGLKVVTTLFPDYDFARQVGGEHAQVSLVLPPGADAHTFELTPEALKTIQSADVFIYTGDEMEPWVAGIRADLEKKGKPLIVNASQGITLKGMADADAHDEDGDAHEHANEASGDAHAHNHSKDPHIWTSLRRAEQMTATIAAAFSQADPAHKADYEQNANAYRDKLHALDQKFTTMINGAKRKTIVVADEFAFLYFADDYGLSYKALVDSANEKAEPGAQRVAELVDFMKKEHIPVVYHTELAEPKMAQLVAKETGAKTMLLDAAHTVSAEDMNKGVTYLDIMGRNYDALNQGLNE